jgi:hypothetical protein
MSTPEYLSISKQHPAFPEYLNFETLRQLGIEHLQKLSGKLWTDYNLHDPGVTILEVLCYAVTELGYRNNLEIQDLLAQKPEFANQADDNFFTPDQILTCNPVTELDLRKRLLDIAGVRNAWIRRFEDYQLKLAPDSEQWTVTLGSQPVNPELQQLEQQLETGNSLPDQPLPSFNLKGLYTVLLDLEPPIQQDACGQVYESWDAVLQEVKTVLHSYRNLCEDIHELIILGEEAIGLQGVIELEASADAEDVLVEILLRIDHFLAPHIQFYTLQELLDRGKDPTEIFAGRPSAIASHDRHASYAQTQSHGFIDPDELQALPLPSRIYTSDLYKIILNVPGVLTVRNFSIRSYINGLPQSQEQPWYLDLAACYRPVLSVNESNLFLLKGGLPATLDQDQVKRSFAQEKLTHFKAYRQEADLDLPIPQGTYYANLAEHYSIHHDFPLTYGISADGLPTTASKSRKAQAKQLKAYLIFFDQMLANYLAQLAHVRNLFSWKEESDQPHTYFTQPLSFPGVSEILDPDSQDRQFFDQLSSEARQKYLDFLAGTIENEESAIQRRNRFLDHMLARFSESFTDYVLLNYRINQNQHESDEQITKGKNRSNELDIKLLHDKAHFLQAYPELSRDRFRAGNYACADGWYSSRVSGFEQHVAHMLGVENFNRQSLIHYRVLHQPTHFTVRLGWRGEDRDYDRPLVMRQTYPTLEAAQKALDTLLSCLLNPSSFQRLIYRNAYHSLEVVDNDGTSLAFYDRSYPTDMARNAAVNSLVEQVQQVLQARSDPSSILVDRMLEFDESEQGIGFTLKLSVAHPHLRFVSAQRYHHHAAARAAASRVLEQIQSKTFYHPISLHPNDVDPTVFVDGKLTTYGFAVVNQGTLLADLDSSLGFHSARTRDSILYALQTNQSTLRIETIQGRLGFSFQIVSLNHLQNRSIVVRSKTTYDEVGIGPAIEELANCLRRFRCYQIATAAESYRLRIVNSVGEVLAESEPQSLTDTPLEEERLAAFAWVNSISPFLLIAKVASARYHFQILDRQELVLLQGSQHWATPTEARDHFYRDVLSLFWESGTLVLTQIDGQYSFVIRGSDQSELATHPHRYRTESERDQAMHRLNVLLRTAHLNALIQQMQPGYMGQIGHDPQKPLLQGTQRFTYELAHLAYFNNIGRNTARVRDEHSLTNLTIWHDGGPQLWHDLTTSIAEHLSGAYAIDVEVIPVEASAQEGNQTTGYRFCLQPSHPPRIQPWQFVSSALYSTFNEAAIRGNDALQLLQSSQIPSLVASDSLVSSSEMTSSTQPLHLLQRQLRDVEYTLVLLDPRQAESAEAEAWNHGNLLTKLAETDDCFRRIDRQPFPETIPNPSISSLSTANYSWAISSGTRHSTLAIHPHYYQQPADRETSIQTLQNVINAEGLHVLEHILLRPHSPDPAFGSSPTLPIRLIPQPDRDGDSETAEFLPLDPYSFWMTVVLPAWPKRFQDWTFRQFVERILREEAPAHLALKIAWVDLYTMQKFEAAYQGWLEQLTLRASQGYVYGQTPALETLLRVLSDLQSIYPAATLADLENSDFTQNPVILNQTPLGSIQ